MRLRHSPVLVLAVIICSLQGIAHATHPQPVCNGHGVTFVGPGQCRNQNNAHTTQIGVPGISLNECNERCCRNSDWCYAATYQNGCPSNSGCYLSTTRALFTAATNIILPGWGAPVSIRGEGYLSYDDPARSAQTWHQSVAPLWDPGNYGCGFSCFNFTEHLAPPGTLTVAHITSTPTTSDPTVSPTESPTTSDPTVSPTESPTTSDPTMSPTQSPTTSDPTVSPTQSPTTSDPTMSPTQSPTTSDPTVSPTESPTTSDPTVSPTQSPTTSDPTVSPTQSPTTSDPTVSPTQSPTTSDPTISPTQSPTTSDPTVSPTQSPTTSDPTLSPTLSPTIGPKITCPVGQAVIYDDVGVEKTYTYDTSVFLVYHTNRGDPFAAVENIPLPTGTSHLHPAESGTPGADLGITVEVSKSQSTAISDEASGVIYQTTSDGTGTYLETNFVSGGDKFFLNQNYTITYTMTDFFGNLDTCTIDLYIVDLESPVITVCPTHVFQTDLNLSTYTASNVLVSGSTIPNVTATDNSGENIVDTALYMGLSYSESDEMVFALDSDGTSGVHDVTYTLTDTSGNSVSCTGTVTVEDVQVPFITCPSIAQVSFEDEHDDVVGLSGSIDGPVYDDQSPFTATYTNTEQATKLVFHTNKRANVATLCGNSGCTGVGPEQIIPDAEISDNSQNLYPNIVLSYTIEQGQADVTNSVFDVSFPGGSILTFTAEDASGNSASCNMEVKIVDLERPRIRCPRDFVYFDPTSETLNTPDWQTTSGTPITPQPYNFHYISIDGASRIRVNWDDPLTYDNIQVNGDIGDTLSGRNIGAFVNGALSSYEKCDNAGPIDDTYAGECVQVNPVQNELFQVRSATGGASGSATRSNNVYNITYSVQDSSGNSATCDFTVSLQVDCSSVFLGDIQKWSRTPAGSQSPPSNCSAGSTGVQTRVCKDNGLFGTEFPDDFNTTNCSTNNFNARSNAVLHLFPYTGVTRPSPPPDSRRTRAKRSEECENANPVDPCEGLTGDDIEYVQVTDPCDPQYIAVISSMNSIYGLSLKELESMIVYKICGESKEISVGQYLAGECLGAKEPTEYGQADPGTCYCDDLCVQYGDCCIDYEEYIGTFQTSSPSTNLPTTLPTQSPTRTPSGSPTVRVITSAPTAVPQSVFSESSYTASWETDASTADADASASDSAFTNGQASCSVYCNSNPGRRRRRQTSTSGSLTSEQVLELLRSTGAPFDDIIGFPVIPIPNRYVTTGVVCENMKWKGDAKRLTSLVRQYIENSNDGGGAIISGGKNTLSPTPAPYTDVVVPRFLLNDSVDEAGNPIEAIENCPDLNTAVVRNNESSDCGPVPFFGHRDAYRCDYWNLSAACSFDEDLSFSDPEWESTCEKLCQQVSIQYPSTPCHAWTLDLSDPRGQGVMCILSDEVPDWALEFSIGNATDLLDSIDTRLSELAGNLALAETNIRALVSTFPTRTPTMSGKGFQKGYTPPPSPAIPSNLLEAVQSIEDDIAYMTDLQSQTVSTIASLTGQLQFRPLSLVSQCFFKSGALDNSTLWSPEACDARLYQPTASPTSTPTSEPTMRPTEVGKGGKGTYPPTISVPTNAPSSSEPTFGPTVFSCDIEAYKTAFFALTSSPTMAPTTSPTNTPTMAGKGKRYSRRSVVEKSFVLQKSAMSSTWQAKQSGAMARSGTFFVGLIALVIIIAYYRHKRKTNIDSRENDKDLSVVTGNASV